MPNNPGAVTKQSDAIITAWGKLAKTATFAGMTLDQFKTKVQPSYDRRKDIADNEAEHTSLLDQRDDADVVTTDSSDKVVKAVVGDVNYGDNSDLYEAMGYKRKSEKASGLTRNTAPVKAAKAAAKAAKKQG